MNERVVDSGVFGFKNGDILIICSIVLNEVSGVNLKQMKLTREQVPTFHIPLEG